MMMKTSWRIDSRLCTMSVSLVEAAIPQGRDQALPSAVEHPPCTGARSSRWMDEASEEGERRGKERSTTWTCHSLLSNCGENPSACLLPPPTTHTHTHTHTHAHSAPWPCGPCLESESPPASGSAELVTKSSEYITQQGAQEI